MVVALVVVRAELTISRDLLLSLAGTAASLSALSLAVVGILQGLNRSDAWFKVALLLVATMFAVVVLGGYYLGMTWERILEQKQHVTAVIVVVIAVVAFFQLDWVWVKLISLAPSAEVTLKRWKLHVVSGVLRVGSFFCVAFCPIWFSGVNRLTFLVLLFAGACIALIVLMAVTTYQFVRGENRESQEDPFLTALRKHYEEEAESLIRLGEIKEHVRSAVAGLQTEEMARVKREMDDTFGSYSGGVSMIERDALVTRLRRQGIKDNESFFWEACERLRMAGVLLSEDGRLWVCPTDDQIGQVVAKATTSNIILTGSSGRTKLEKGRCELEGIVLTGLCNWLSKEMLLPLPMLKQNVMPSVAGSILDGSLYEQYEKGSIRLFCRHDWPLSADVFDDLWAKAGKTGRGRSSDDEDQIREFLRLANGIWASDYFGSSNSVESEWLHDVLKAHCQR